MTGACIPAAISFRAADWLLIGLQGVGGFIPEVGASWAEMCHKLVADPRRKFVTSQSSRPGGCVSPLR